MGKKPRFTVGQTVVALKETRGSYEPSTCKVGEKMEVNEIKRCGDTFQYTCGYDGYTLLEEELATPREYAKKEYS